METPLRFWVNRVDQSLRARELTVGTKQNCDCFIALAGIDRLSPIISSEYKPPGAPSIGSILPVLFTVCSTRLIFTGTRNNIFLRIYTFPLYILEAVWFFKASTFNSTFT